MEANYTKRKHSSGDLHSRLKTRKLLGVGETDDGDIHRSKLSQILGHSDQLYIRLPYGLRVWQLLLAIMFSVVGIWAIFFPSHLFESSVESGQSDHVTLPVRLYGGALVSLSVVFWSTLYSHDRDMIRMCLLTSLLYFSIQIVVTVGHLCVYSRLPEQQHNLSMLLLSRGVFAGVSGFYHWALTQRKFSPCAPPAGSLRRNASSPKELSTSGYGNSSSNAGSVVAAPAGVGARPRGDNLPGSGGAEGGACGGHGPVHRVKSKDV